MNPQKLPLVATFAAGLGLGLAAAFVYSPDSPDSKLQKSSQSSNLPTAALSDAANSFAPAATPSEPPVSIENLDARVATAYAFRSERRKAWEIERLFENMSAQDAPALLNAILANPDYHKPYGLLGPFFGKWAELDGAAAFQASQQLEGREQRDAEKYLFPGWAKSDARGAWEALQSMPKATLRDAYAEVAREYTRQFPDDAMRSYLSNPQSDTGSYLRSGLIDAAAKANQLPQLLAKVSSLPDEDERNRWTTSIFANWSMTDPKVPLESISRIQDPEIASAALEGFLNGWVRTDRKGAVDYAFNNLGDPAVERAFRHIISYSMFTGTPAETADLVNRLEAAGRLEDAAQMGLQYSHPEFALQIVNRISDPMERAKIETSAFRRLATESFDKALAYYDQQQSPEAKSRLLTTLATELHRRSDGGTLLASLAESAPTEKDRTQLLETLLFRFVNMAPAASKDFMTGLELLTEDVSKLSPNAVSAREKLFGANTQPAPK